MATWKGDRLGNGIAAKEWLWHPYRWLEKALCGRLAPRRIEPGERGIPCAGEEIGVRRGVTDRYQPVEISPVRVRDLSTGPAQDGFMKQTVLSAGLVLAALAKNLDRAAEKRNISVAEALTVSGQTLNILGANDSPSTPLGPNQLNMHADFQSIRFPAPPLAVHNTI